MTQNKKVVIIGAGLGGLATAGLLAKKGYQVTLIEKNKRPGGKANLLEVEGFVFDMGPSWYMMPDVFEHWFRLMDEKVSDHLTLVKLPTSYRVRFAEDGQEFDFHSDLKQDAAIFESLEKGAGEKIKDYVKESEKNYHIAKQYFLYRNYDSFKDLFSLDIAKQGRNVPLFSKMHGYIGKYFKHPKIHKILQFMMVFLGSSPYNAPALYNLMAYTDFGMGVFYPMGGIHEVPLAMEKICHKYGVKTLYQSPVKKIEVREGRACGVLLETGEFIPADVVVVNTDRHHAEMQLLAAEQRSTTERYWKKRTLAPSAFIMYLGLKRKLIKTPAHHTLVFCESWKKNFDEIYKNPVWPTDPSLYVCAPSVTDPSVAPEGKENLFVLIPIAAGLTYTEKTIEEYADKILTSLSVHLEEPDLKNIIEVKRVYCVNDFIADYNSYKGGALGLAHTLLQTAIFRPNNISKKVSGLYFVGADTNPGIGMPITLISAELAYKRIVGIKSQYPLESL